MGDKSKTEKRGKGHTMGKDTETRGFFDLKKQFIFYASYHNDSVNVGIHLLCIWNLVWSGLALQHMLGVFAPAPTSMATLPLVGGVPLTLATVTTAIYVVSYVMMDPVAAVLAFHVAAWIAQFIGHGVFEGRAPALLDSWDQ